MIGVFALLVLLLVAAGVIEDGIDIEASYTTEFSDTGAALEIKSALTGQ